jgi:hypothetical protein
MANAPTCRRSARRPFVRVLFRLSKPTLVLGAQTVTKGFAKSRRGPHAPYGCRALCEAFHSHLQPPQREASMD